MSNCTLRNVMDPFPIGWQIADGNIIAPCGCKGKGLHFTPCPEGVFDPEEGKLEFEEFEDCGKSGDYCVFQSRLRVHAFRNDIPSNKEVWELFNMNSRSR
jgi:hypothetical protein